MPATSAGLLLFRRRAAIEVFVAHMGGPFWARKDAGAWSIPKGEYGPGEDPLAVALREFEEEIGTPPPAADYRSLGEFRQASGKRVTVFVAEAEFEIEGVVSNTFPLEWPPRSGRIQEFPEVDDARWFPVEVALGKVVRGQRAALDALVSEVGDGSPPS